MTKSTSKSKASSKAKAPAASPAKAKAKPASKSATKPSAKKTASKATPAAAKSVKAKAPAKKAAAAKKATTKPAAAKKAVPAKKAAAKAPAKSAAKTPAAKAKPAAKPATKAKAATKSAPKKAPAKATSTAKSSTPAKATSTKSAPAKKTATPTKPKPATKATAPTKPAAKATSKTVATTTPAKAAAKPAAKAKPSPKAKTPVDNTTPKPKAAVKAADTATTDVVDQDTASADTKKKAAAAKTRKTPARPRRPSAATKTASDRAAAGKSDTMKAYMREIGQIPLVTREEEVDLAALIAAGDADARAKLIQSNLRLVVKIAHDFKGLGLPLLDLISEGNIGLMKAVEKFDPSKGAKFSSYAAWWIKQSMRRALSNQSRTIRIPVQSAGKINKIKSARMKLTEELGREPTDIEIANHLEFSERTVASLRLAELRTFSLQDPIQQGEESMFQDIIPDYGTATPDEHISDMEMLKQLKHLIARLDERERLILMMRFGLDGSRPKTLEEVSKIIGRTRERVRQIQNQALTKLRKFIEEDQVQLEQPAEAEV